MRRTDLMNRRASRRDMLKQSAGAAAIAGATAGMGGIPAVALRQASTPPVLNTDVSGDLVEWGFGVAETNPLARSRVEAFQEAYPNVNLQIVESFDEQKLLTAAAAEQLPDVIWLSRFETATWAARGVLQPLTEFIERDNYDTSNFYEAALREATFEDELYGIPGGMDVRMLFVNVDHLTEAGIDPATIDTSNWEQLNEMGAQLVQSEGGNVTRWGFDNKIQAGGIWLWGRANGGSFIDEDGTEATFNDDLVVEALEWGVQGYEAQGGFQAYESLATTFQGDEQFPRGLVSMTIYEQWMMSGPLVTVAPDMNFLVFPVRERGSGPEGQMTSFTGGNAWYITSGAKNPDAAWEFIKFLHTDETWRLGAMAVKAARESENRPYFPSLTGSMTADRLQIEEIYEPLGETYDAAVALLPELLEVSENREIAKSPVAGQLDDIMQNEGVEPALRGQSSAEEALTTADESAQNAIDSF
ncbi:MAG TPA: ABC transporter substrate-binding protein [Thermomicrobiales bacterium]|nr:ABC transporter substrate-binding protein [Thermomicrobiales bacterium]